MAYQTLAPWAEPAPGHSPMTAEELARLPDDGWTYEPVDGSLVRMPLAGTRHGRRVMLLAFALMNYTEPRGLGNVFTAETGFLISRPDERDTVLGPDVAFLRTDRIPPESEQDQAFWRVAPDLAVELASLNQFHPELAAKAHRYRAAAVQLVWVLWPRHRRVDVWRAGATTQPMALGIADELDGGDIIPGFHYPVAQLFP